MLKEGPSIPPSVHSSNGITDPPSEQTLSSARTINPRRYSPKIWSQSIPIPPEGGWRRRRDLNPRSPYGDSTLAGWCTRPDYATSPDAGPSLPRQPQCLDLGSPLFPTACGRQQTAHCGSGTGQFATAQVTSSAVWPTSPSRTSACVTGWSDSCSASSDDVSPSL